MKDPAPTASLPSDRRRWLLGLCALPLLAACGTPHRLRNRQPRVSLAGVERDTDGWHVRLRVQNVIDKELTLSAVELRLECGQAQADLRSNGLSVRIPPLASEVVRLPVALPAPFVDALEQAAGRRGGAAYRLQGEVQTTDPDRRFRVEYDGFLSPVPGREGAYR